MAALRARQRLPAYSALVAYVKKRPPTPTEALAEQLADAKRELGSLIWRHELRLRDVLLGELTLKQVQEDHAEIQYQTNMVADIEKMQRFQEVSDLGGF